MTDNYINPIDKKLSTYAHRMRELILEAYAEGIVLNTSTNELTRPHSSLAENQCDRQIVVGVNATEHSHPQLCPPDMVSAKAVVEISQSIVLPKKIESPQPRPLVPLYTKDSACCFVSSDLVPPWVTDADNNETSALKFGMKMDLISLSQSDKWLKSGKVYQNDIIDETVHLKEIFYRRPDGKVDSFKVGDMPFALFTAATSGDYKDLTVDFTCMLPTDLSTIRVSGRLNRLYGSAYLTAETSDRKVMPLGFTLIASRIRPIK